MSKLNMKVIDMEPPMLDATKKVGQPPIESFAFSILTRPSRTIARRDSSQTR